MPSLCSVDRLSKSTAVASTDPVRSDGGNGSVEASALLFTPECAFPELNVGAARVLLRILRKALARQLAAESHNDALTPIERDVA